jgi:hypothetical protein
MIMKEPKNNKTSRTREGAKIKGKMEYSGRFTKFLKVHFCLLLYHCESKGRVFESRRAHHKTLEFAILVVSPPTSFKALLDAVTNFAPTLRLVTNANALSIASA